MYILEFGIIILIRDYTYCNTQCVGWKRQDHQGVRDYFLSKKNMFNKFTGDIKKKKSENTQTPLFFRFFHQENCFILSSQQAGNC